GLFALQARLRRRAQGERRRARPPARAHAHPLPRDDRPGACAPRPDQYRHALPPRAQPGEVLEDPARGPRDLRPRGRRRERDALSPLGHGTWTAIVAGTIWRQKSARGIRIDGPVLLALAAAIGLHGLYDWQPFPGYYGILWSVGVGLIGIVLLRFVVQRATQ